MRHFLVAASAAAMAASGAASAALVEVDFTILIEAGTSPMGNDVAGTTFAGMLTYDDATVLPQIGGFIADLNNGDLTITFPFLDRTVVEAQSDVAPFAEFDTDGTLTNLNFGVDVPSEFFLSVEGLSFVYDFSNQDFETIASGNGSILLDTDVGEVPLPGAALFFGTALAAGALRKRFKR